MDNPTFGMTTRTTKEWTTEDVEKTEVGAANIAPNSYGQSNFVMELDGLVSSSTDGGKILKLGSMRRETEADVDVDLEEDYAPLPPPKASAAKPPSPPPSAPAAAAQGNSAATASSTSGGLGSTNAGDGSRSTTANMFGSPVQGNASTAGSHQPHSINLPGVYAGEDQAGLGAEATYSDVDTIAVSPGHAGGSSAPAAAGVSRFSKEEDDEEPQGLTYEDVPPPPPKAGGSVSETAFGTPTAAFAAAASASVSNQAASGAMDQQQDYASIDEREDTVKPDGGDEDSITGFGEDEPAPPEDRKTATPTTSPSFAANSSSFNRSGRVVFKGTGSFCSAEEKGGSVQWYLN